MQQNVLIQKKSSKCAKIERLKLTGVDLCSEGCARHEFLVEGDVDDVIGALQGNEADDEPR